MTKTALASRLGAPPVALACLPESTLRRSHRFAARLFRAIALCVFVVQSACIVNMVASSAAKHRAAEFNGHDVDTIVKQYSQDAAFFTADGVRLQGRDAIRDYLRALFAVAPDIHVELIDQDTTSVMGGYRSTAHVAFTSQGKTWMLEVDSLSRKEAGKYVTYQASNKIMSGPPTAYPGGCPKGQEGACVVNAFAGTAAKDRAAVFNRHDPDALAATYSEDVVFTTEDGTRLEGREAVRGYYRALFAAAPDMHVELADQNTVAESGNYKSTATLTVTAQGKTWKLELDTTSRQENGAFVAYEATSKVVSGTPVAPPVISHPAAAGEAGCSDDKGCKGSRVCRGGKCVEP
ncbi:MAG: YybH family protein [Polyangiaceae bacterium]